MAQENVWDREYRKSKLLTKENKPQADVVRFVQFLKREQGIEVSNLRVLDLGSGTGRNSFYFAELGVKVIGLEISDAALTIAKENIREHLKTSGVSYDISYDKKNIGERLPYENSTFDILLDVTSSNSLTELEREMYLIETHRVLKESGYFFVKALCKDGDENAKTLLKKFPGKEKDTYVMPDIGIVERVWTKEDFVRTYEKYFTIVGLEKKTSYTRMNGRSYKRNFWIGYLRK